MSSFFFEKRYTFFRFTYTVCREEEGMDRGGGVSRGWEGGAGRDRGGGEWPASWVGRGKFYKTGWKPKIP